ncbi:BTAD domain-containing putative transcriptional regulator [Mycobacterium asiaticum]|uniref:BTAD domain-containing putative transcriptional regulator n=1 Tax=Mycobacterium asiaticum TaxID=1790 RepID=UPI0020A338BA|nr:BTAD domain-containing putative transcriptional regulator [Mycobacterium asiaticum]
MELGVLGPLQVRQDGTPVTIPGAKPRAILTLLGLHNGSVVSADTLIELLWGEDPPRTAAKALQTHISTLRRALGDGVVVTAGAGWTLKGSDVDASRFRLAAKLARDAAAAGNTSGAGAHFEEALTLWRGIPELPDGRRGLSEKTRWIEGHAAVVEDRADALLATGRAAEVIGDLESAVAEAPLRERRWAQLMLALYRSGRQGEALAAYQRARSLLADELGMDPGPELRRLEAAIVAQDVSLDHIAEQQLSSVTRAVTFLLTDIEGSTAAWEANAAAMAVALARHDELVLQVVTSRGGRLIKTRGEGDATFSVFDRPSAAAAAAVELQEAIGHEPWPLPDPMRIRIALHTGEAELRDGDYFGRAVNRAARLRSLADGGQILCSGATAELVIDTLPDDVDLADLGMRQLRNLARPEHVFELRLGAASAEPDPQPSDAPFQRPDLPAVLVGPGPFVGRGAELERLLAAWHTASAGGARAVLIAGEPGVGKTRLAGEWSQRAYDQGAVVLYGRCDEDLGAPYQPFAEALRSIAPCLGATCLREVRGVEALLALVPGLTDVVPDLASRPRSDPDTERYALFDAVVAILEVASQAAPVVLILDDLHWAAKPTLLLLRHLLRFGERARLQIVGTYRNTDLDRSHPLAAMLADLHRDAGSGTASRLSLGGLDEDDVTAYVAEVGYDDEELAHALASVTGGNPFFLIEALRHVDESGGVWDQTTLPQGVREAVSRRLSRLPIETNKALAAAAVVGSRFAIDLVEQVVGSDLVDAFDEARQAGIVIEEPGGHYRFNHALVRQSLLAELASVRRMRLHQRIATTLEARPGADDELLAELAHHYFECAWAGNAAKAAEYCRRAADQAMAKLAYEGAADLYDHALHALEELDDELPDRDEQAAALLIARCEALFAAGDMASAAGAVAQLQAVTVDSPRLSAWATCFDGQLSMLKHPERLDEVETALRAAAQQLASLGDSAGEAKAHTVRAASLARLGRIADCEIALDDALTVARNARDHRRVNAVLAGAPVAALWGPNPVPRAGGRCLDVVRLLRITTDSPAVEATSTRCQALLEAFRGRTAAARRMIDSARRTVTELGLRHALLEVEQFAGIVELIGDEPEAAEPQLRLAYNGFRRMGLDADTAETAALLGRACLALNRHAEADVLCTESEHLAGHALKASIAWRTLRAQLLSCTGDYGTARRVAEEAVTLAERTDALVDHGDACLTLAAVCGAAGDATAARTAAERAVGLYERKGAVALAEKARRVFGEPAPPIAVAPSQNVDAEPDNTCTRAVGRLVLALNSEAWSDVEQVIASDVDIESRRKIVGFTRDDRSSRSWIEEMERLPREMGSMHYRFGVLAVRGERLALIRLKVGTADPDPGAPQDEMLHVTCLDEEGRIGWSIWFDVDDIEVALAELDAAQARLEQGHARRLENAASKTGEHMRAHFAARSWAAIAEILTEDIRLDDRRHVVNSGRRQGRKAAIEELQSTAGIGVETVTAEVVATRGDRLVLCRTQTWGRDQRPEAFHTDVFDIIEVDDKGLVQARVIFDHNDFGEAIAELDTRYARGEAAPHADTWRAVAKTFASIKRHELPEVSPGCATTDHRRVIALSTDESRVYIEKVHRLSDLGVVFTYSGFGFSRGGSAGARPEIAVSFVESGIVNRCELFDEVDLDSAIARFEELQPDTRRLENTASRVGKRFLDSFAAGEWEAVAELLAENFSNDDRRSVVGAGVRRGREAELVDLRAIADLWSEYVSLVILATRGERLVLARLRFSSRNVRTESFSTEVLGILEIDTNDQIVACVFYEPNDFDAAITELDARFLAGEAAPFADTWRTIAGTYRSMGRGELPALTPDAPDVVNVDHRRTAAVASGDLVAYIRAGWDLEHELRPHVQVVHRLNSIGAVVTYLAYGGSQEGFDAEWRGVAVSTVDGDGVNRCEMYEDADLDAALARFEELQRPLRRLHNTASESCARFGAAFAARDWDAITDTLADNAVTDDRRRVVSAGIRHGRDAVIADLQAMAGLGGTNIASIVLAVRGERLVLNRTRFSGRDLQTDRYDAEALVLVEIDCDGRMVAHIAFDVGEMDAAFAELDARYLAGDAAAHPQAWACVAGALACVNRHMVAETTPDFVNIDHRRGAAFPPGEVGAYIRASWELMPNRKIYAERVHRLSDLGAVFSWIGCGTSEEGFDAEWRGVDIITVEGDLISRFEMFDEADLDTALERFDQLHPQQPQPRDPASQLIARFVTNFAARDWDAMTELFAPDYYNDDRRRVVNAGVRQGRDAAIEDLRVSTELGLTTSISVDLVAARGKHLLLTNFHISGQDPEAVQYDVLQVVEYDDAGAVAAAVMFDIDDIDAAFAELDARYLGGEAAEHADTWSLVMSGYAALNRHELPATTADWVDLDHRPVVAVAEGDLGRSLRAVWELAPRATTRVEAVHRLGSLGAVVTHTVQATTRDGMDAEWRDVVLITFAGNKISRCEVFDESDLGAALARFDVLVLSP